MFNAKKISCSIFKKNLSKLKLKLREKRNPKEWLIAQDKTLIQHHRTTKMRNEKYGFLKIN